MESRLDVTGVRMASAIGASALLHLALIASLAPAPAIPAAAPLTARLRSLAGQLNGLESLPTVPEGARVDGAIVAAVADRIVLDSLFRDGFAGSLRTIDSLADAQVEARVAAGVGDRTRARSEARG